MAGQWYRHWKEVPEWLWPENFHPSTDKMLASPDTGEIYFDIESFQSLQRLRESIGPIHVLSGYRSKVYNARKGGTARSQHFELIAFDIIIGHRDIREVAQRAVSAGFKGIGYYPSRGFLHIDRGPSRTWYGSQKDKQIMTQTVDYML